MFLFPFCLEDCLTEWHEGLVCLGGVGVGHRSQAQEWIGSRIRIRIRTRIENEFVVDHL